MKGNVMARRSWICLVLAGCGVPVAGLLTSACGNLEAQQSVSTECNASVAVIGSSNVCPTAPIRFRISVSGCEHSSGTFDYDYKLVNELRKAPVRRSGTWTRNKKAWDQTEYVPMACGEEIDDVEIAGAASCTCKGP